LDWNEAWGEAHSNLFTMASLSLPGGDPEKGRAIDTLLFMYYSKMIFYKFVLIFLY